MEVRLLVSKQPHNRKEGFRRTVGKSQIPEKAYSGSHPHPEETKSKKNNIKEKIGIFSDSKRCIAPINTTSE